MRSDYVDELAGINEAVRSTETPIVDLTKALIDYVDAIINARDNSE
jgi:hypothetical protein